MIIVILYVTTVTLVLYSVYQYQLRKELQSRVGSLQNDLAKRQHDRELGRVLDDNQLRTLIAALPLDRLEPAVAVLKSRIEFLEKELLVARRSLWCQALGVAKFPRQSKPSSG